MAAAPSTVSIDLSITAHTGSTPIEIGTLTIDVPLKMSMERSGKVTVSIDGNIREHLADAFTQSAAILRAA